jgi:hypothetical protein
VLSKALHAVAYTLSLLGVKEDFDICLPNTAYEALRAEYGKQDDEATKRSMVISSGYPGVGCMHVTRRTIKYPEKL